MADQKITQLNQNTAPATTDLLVIVDDPSGSPETQKIEIEDLFENNLAGVSANGFLNFGAPTEITISSGTVTATRTYHTVDTESDAASDDLDTINGGSNGDLLIIGSADSTRDVVCKDATGNLRLDGDFTLSSVNDKIVLIYRAGVWDEISRSDNV